MLQDKTKTVIRAFPSLSGVHTSQPRPLYGGHMTAKMGDIRPYLNKTDRPPIELQYPHICWPQPPISKSGTIPFSWAIRPSHSFQTIKTARAQIRDHEPFLDHFWHDLLEKDLVRYSSPHADLDLRWKRMALNKLTAGWNTCPNRVIARLGHLCALLFLHCNSMMLISPLTLHYINCRIAFFPRLSISLMSYCELVVEVLM